MPDHALNHPRDRTIAQGLKRARTIRRCGNRHAILPGDPVVYWTGILEGEFSPWEECRECERLGWGMPWLAHFWTFDRSRPAAVVPIRTARRHRG